MLTLEEIEALDRLVLTPEDVRGVLACNPHLIRIIARSDHPEKLGFPVTVLGHRTKIPRIPFLNYMKGRRG